MSEIITHPLEIKLAAEAGTFEGYGSIFSHIDRDGDVIAPGAFAASIKDRIPALLWQHNPKEPIGRFDEVREDPRGLFVRGRLSLKGRGEEAYSLLKMGAMNGLSIGFVAKEASRDTASGVRTIHKADLMEVSLVTFPANEAARVETIKGNTLPNTPRDFEGFLREAGFSRSNAKAITAKGFSVINSQREADADLLNHLPLELRQHTMKIHEILEI